MIRHPTTIGSPGKPETSHVCISHDVAVCEVVGRHTKTAETEA